MDMSIGFQAGLAASGPALNAYWGQSKGHQLRDICNSGVQYATVSFINNSPEHGSGYPGSNFGANCASDVYMNNGKVTKLQSSCTLIQQDIPYCQDMGVKVLLSIGGEATSTSQYDVSTDDKGREFAEFLYNAFGPKKASWTGPRPFDTPASLNTPARSITIDGFDLDLENSSMSNSPYIAMVNWWRQQSHKMFITAAPQCVITNAWNTNHNDDLIANAQFDALFIQFYNNPVCDAIPGNTPGDSFSYDQFTTVLSKGKSKNAKIFIGLPGATSAAGSGYIVPAAVKDLVCQYSTRSNFGGVSLWDGTVALDNKDASGKSFLQSAAEAVKYLCKPVPTTTSTTATSTKTSTTSSTVKPTTTSTTATSTKTSTTSSTTSSTVKPTTTSTTATSTKTSTTSSTVKPTTTSTTSTASETTSTKTSTTSSTVKSTTSTASETTTTSETSTASSTTSEKPNTTTTTSEKPDTTTTTEVTATDSKTSSGVIVTSSTHWSNSTATTTSKPVSMTTSTVYTTSVHTVTKCPPTVTNCPVGHVTTETIALYTTVCPVTETAHPHKPTTTKAPVMTTSTVYTTKTYTITKCPPYVTNCPVGHVTTEVIPMYTTVCPVEETQTGKVPQPTPSAPSSLLTSVRTTVVVPKPSEGCSGPGCPVASSTSGSGCTGPECPAASSTSGSGCTGPECPGASSTSGSGCTGPQCPGVAIPTNSWASVSVGPSATPSSPVTAGASTLALGLTGLVAMVVAQILVL